ncbi:MAG: metal ABC transporter permease, partial [Flintibacter sp.]|nr:metal ABC transporter permease [Flintibacter sp.]
MELWYSLVELLPFDWAQSGGMYFMKNALLAVLVISPL